MPDQDFDEITPFEQGSDARFANQPLDPLQTDEWQIGWHDTDRDLRALDALNRGAPCPVCAAGERCVICAGEGTTSQQNNRIPDPNPSPNQLLNMGC